MDSCAWSLLRLISSVLQKLVLDWGCHNWSSCVQSYCISNIPLTWWELFQVRGGMDIACSLTVQGGHCSTEQSVHYIMLVQQGCSGEWGALAVWRPPCVQQGVCSVGVGAGFVLQTDCSCWMLGLGWFCVCGVWFWSMGNLGVGDSDAKARLGSPLAWLRCLGWFFGPWATLGGPKPAKPTKIF